MSDLEIKAIKDFNINGEDLDVFGNNCMKDCTYEVTIYYQTGMKKWDSSRRSWIYCYSPNPYRCTCY